MNMAQEERATVKFDEMRRQALDEIGLALAGLTDGAAERMADEILRAGTIVCFGLGREGLMVRALCMRLMHLGLRAHVAGDVTTPPVGLGDLAIVSAGPGEVKTAETIVDLAKGAEARVLVVTARPDGSVPRKAHVVIHLPAQTMADDRGGASLLPMGTTFEITMLIFFDLVALTLMAKTGQTMEQIRARHFNLE
jgi:6-phospho-3-hexuloisomerase